MVWLAPRGVTALVIAAAAAFALASVEPPWLAAALPLAVVVVLAAEFRADPAVVAADVSAFLDELEAEGMVNATSPRAAR